MISTLIKTIIQRIIFIIKVGYDVSEFVVIPFHPWPESFCHRRQRSSLCLLLPILALL